MKLVHFFAIFVALLSSVVWTQPYNGPTWQSKTAEEKQQLLWQAITRNETSGPWPSSLELAEIFLEDMSPTFDAVRDDLPTSVNFSYM
jgi:hypothetical protein